MSRAPIALSAQEFAYARSLVIEEDAAILALNKPSGLSSQGGRIKAHTLDDLIWAFARSNGKRPELVHRLDRDTSGVILAAKTKPAAGFLGKAIAARKVKKTYLALIAAPPEPRNGTIDTPLRREEIGREAYMRATTADHPDAEAALSRYRTLATSDGATLVELQPHTGRMHQLRVHLASIGRPILGDIRYGGALTAGGAGAPRLMLHALRLEFPHPEGGVRTIEAPPPEDFQQVARTAGLDISGG